MGSWIWDKIDACCGLSAALRRLALSSLAVPLLFLAAPATVLAEEFHFTVTADPRSYDYLYDDTLAAMQSLVGGQGAFQVAVGDIDSLQPLRDKIDARFGGDALWYPVVGNHEAETPADMTWIRNEYETGNGVRTPLKYFTYQNGPTGSVETTYSWDYGNAHFVVLNEYWNGGTAPGSDAATDGDIVPELYDWLAADLAATGKSNIFVFGHEPAFPLNRHVGDSLDKYPENRDAFWSLLESYGVDAFFVGHTHYYSTYQSDGGSVWQIDLGNAGNGIVQTFVDVAVTGDTAVYSAYNNDGGTWHLYQTWSTGPPIPEPGTVVLVGLGLAGLALKRFGKKRNAG